MLQLDWATLAFQTINFLVLLWLLNRFLFKPLRGKLDERGRTIAEDLQSARSQEAEAALLRTEWEERRRTVEGEAEEILQTSRREATEMSAELFEEARTRLDRLTEEMRLDLVRQRNEIIVQQYDGILDTIITLSGNVVQSVTTRRTHDDLVTNFCASIYQMSQTDIDEYRRLLAGRIPTAFVSTPVALTAEQSQTLADTLSSLIDRRVELQVSIDPELVAGIQVRLADKLIDNSIRQQLDRIRERVRRDLIAQMGASAQHE
jgi:F-type H+-transporting ATPase subunit b